MATLNIIINRKIVKGKAGETILELARRLNLDIPTLCHDPRLEPFSSCYLCVVEVEGMRGLQPACSTLLTEGMRIETHTEKVEKARKFALELLVSNHYADCTAPCRQTCPAGVDVQAYIALINQGKHREAVGVIKQTNPLPAICGRVCVRPCEVACRRNLVDGQPVGIDYLKRYTSDQDLAAEDRFVPECKPATGKKVAIIGAGPGGLSAAYFMAVEGHQVEVFEASPHPGGMLRYGIPPYRLPNEIIDQETKAITDLGVQIHYNQKLGDNLRYLQLKESFDAIILAIGSQNGTRIGCENDDAGNIFSGIDFLRNMEMTGQKYDFSGKKVAVIGGGNTAMDCCRTAKRCGAEEVMVLYRRTEKEMPANPIEIHESKLEGIDYHFLTAPAKVNTDAQGNLSTLTCYRMELGEPDASGRRRPVKVEGSEFDIQLDYILAAIGQKTHVNFIEDINTHSDTELLVNKWGDIDAQAETLQTSIAHIFACGDGVTGPATLIEAIAQARLAAQSCHKYLMGQSITPPDFEFISRKDHFRLQEAEEYQQGFMHQQSQEMPTLAPRQRNNFEEVELGYSHKQALDETHRCLECGCTALYSCDLKKYATQYQAKQERFSGDFRSYPVDFSHPYIEIDNNKCILCGRCVRICKEVVGANALGFINRGFDTYVAPSMGESLQQTACESCGMCISTCPTGALSENVPFKPGPLKTQALKSICNYCSVGCELQYHHKNGFVTGVTGSDGLGNPSANLCRMGRFGYHHLNRQDRITTPLLKENGQWTAISFEQAYQMIVARIKAVHPDQNAFFAGARMTNEEQYLVQKLARAACATHNVSSFLYDQKDNSLLNCNLHNVPFEQIKDSGHIWIFGGQLNLEHGVAGFEIYNATHRYQIPLSLIHTADNTPMDHKANEVTRIKSYYHFLKAAIYHILAQGEENQVYLEDHTSNFEAFKARILAEDFAQLVLQAGIDADHIRHFAHTYNQQPQAILIYAEKELDEASIQLIENLALITGKTGKTASGIIALRQKNNSQGLWDMGCKPSLLPGGNPVSDNQTQQKLCSLWDLQSLPQAGTHSLIAMLEAQQIVNLFIFAEDPVGSAWEPESMRQIIRSSNFMVVQDYFLSPTAQLADLVLPASYPFETGGSYTNTNRYIQQISVDKQWPNPIAQGSYQQLAALINMLGKNGTYDSIADVLMEIASVLQKPELSYYNLHLNGTPDIKSGYQYGCDILKRAFEQNYDQAFQSHPQSS